MEYIKNSELWKRINDQIESCHPLILSISDSNSHDLTEIKKIETKEVLIEKGRVFVNSLQSFAGKYFKGNVTISEINENMVIGYVENVRLYYSSYTWDTEKKYTGQSLNFKYDKAFKDQLLKLGKGSDVMAEGKFILLDGNEINLELMSIEKSGSGCFIATACYGSYLAPEVVLLRKFRDEKLSKKIMGKVSISLYYKISPVSSVFQLLTKIPLEPFVGLISFFILGDPALFLGYVC